MGRVRLALGLVVGILKSSRALWSLGRGVVYSLLLSHVAGSGSFGYSHPRTANRTQSSIPASHANELPAKILDRCDRALIITTSWVSRRASPIFFLLGFLRLA
jgi:hypothetical protein